MTNTPEQSADNPMLEALAARKTVKLFAPAGVTPSGTLTRERIDVWMDAAGNAPFHKPSHPDHDKARGVRAREPWRVTKLDAAACQKMIAQMHADGLEADKLVSMINGAEGMAIVSFLPNPPETELGHKQDFEPTFDNMEIIAAAGAFCQSVLLASESDGYSSYWSSGGDLRKAWGADYLGRGNAEVVIGALFFFPAQTPEGAEVGFGSLADKRSSVSDWSVWLD